MTGKVTYLNPPHAEQGFAEFLESAVRAVLLDEKTAQVEKVKAIEAGVRLETMRRKEKAPEDDSFFNGAMK